MELEIWYFFHPETADYNLAVEPTSLRRTYLLRAIEAQNNKIAASMIYKPQLDPYRSGNAGVEFLKGTGPLHIEFQLYFFHFYTFSSFQDVSLRLRTIKCLSANASCSFQLSSIERAKIPKV